MQWMCGRWAREWKVGMGVVAERGGMVWLGCRQCQLVQCRAEQEHTVTLTARREGTEGRGEGGTISQCPVGPRLAARF